MATKPRVFLTSNIFSSAEIGNNPKISQDIRDSLSQLWKELDQIAKVIIYNGRFPDDIEIQKNIEQFDPLILGCHLSHPITSEMLENSNIVAVCTATVGYNHIQIPEKNDILITHTPGVLFEAVADYTLALIMSNLRNVIDLHNYVWSEKWVVSEKWDMDQNLSSSIKNNVLGLIGLGEIGTEILRKVHNWGLKILYYDIERREELEKQFENLEFVTKLENLFEEADIISLHIPLNRNTENLINKDLLKVMKKNSFLINTARGKILNLTEFLDLLEKKEILVNFAFDVYPQEPIDIKTLKRIKAIKTSQPDIRMILMPHNASADANTRGRMVNLFLKDIIKIIQSRSIQDLKDVHIIPEQKKELEETNWRIKKYWLEQ